MSRLLSLKDLFRNLLREPPFFRRTPILSRHASRRPSLTNGSTKLNGVSSTPDSVPTPAGEPAVEVATNGVSEEAEDKEKEKEEREAKARKKELDALNEQYKDIPLGSKAELVHLDKRWDKNGDEYYVKQNKVAARIRGGDWWEKHILAVIRHFEEDEPDKVEKTSVEIYSDHLRKTLARVIGSYPGISFRTEHISLDLPVEGICRARASQHLNQIIETQFADTIEEDAGFYVMGYFTNYDGVNLVPTASGLKIPPFSGSTAIPTLPTAPLDMRTRAEELKVALIKRGKRFESLKGQNHGNTLAWPSNRIKSRVMVDAVSYNRMCAEYSWEARRSDRGGDGGCAARAAEKAARALDDEQRCLPPNVVRGFSFAEKKWFLLFLDNFSDIAWNEVILFVGRVRSFDRLVLEESSKNLVRALVTAHLRDADSKFDDIIKGKGRGLIFVLHGPPGVGKTLTAECIAEHSHRPLYVISSGDLGTEAGYLEDQLTQILDLAHTWNAILLIDEADVFLEKLLRGLLFLTTNRVNTFDPAFQSRIHMALRYDNLEIGSRKLLWKDFLSKLKGAVDVDDAGYDALATYNMNGRQIKNAVKTSESLASFSGTPLSLVHLEAVLKSQGEFANSFADGF
ncbi:P-loop containing nucleoside triphosphate hydrolase protein [Mycena rebaudengoi]|nr:P-loop containing nucleoside triphosphate hydrolase protein [Mycena rebaudengoi]